MFRPAFMCVWFRPDSLGVFVGVFPRVDLRPGIERENALLVRMEYQPLQPAIVPRNGCLFASLKIPAVDQRIITSGKKKFSARREASQGEFAIVLEELDLLER